MTPFEPIPGLEDAFQRFACDPPPDGSRFQVLRQEWEYDAAGIAFRTICEVRVIDGTLRHD